MICMQDSKRTVMIVSSSRAERGLLHPVALELVKYGNVKVEWGLITPSDAATVLSQFIALLDLFKPDIIVVPTDRWEIVYVAAYAFHHDYFTVHFHAGNNPANHPDDINRRVISSFSHIMLSNMPEHKENLVKQGEEPSRIHVVGSTAFDHIELDDTVTPKEAFNLVILHPSPLSRMDTIHDLGFTIEAILESESKYKSTVWIYPNHDANYDIIEKYLDNLRPNGQFFKYRNLPRAQYFSLLKNCSCAIGNSSSFYYEMPILDKRKKLVQIGERNRGLVVPKTVTGGSKRIAKLLATIALNDEVLRKKWVRQPETFLPHA